MKTKVVNEFEFEISDFEILGIVLKHLVNAGKLVLSNEDNTKISIHRDKIVVNVIKREYKKS